VEVEQNGRRLSAITLMASGGASGVHAASLAVAESYCLAAIGPFIVRLELPDLSVQWATKADYATCFGVYLLPNEVILSHGELSVARLSACGRVLWQRTGREPFTGSFQTDGKLAVVEDFEGTEHSFELESGNLQRN
jgi:hypothetical protein